MTLKPTDMLEIQSAIDAYERKFPRRPEPSATVALKWRLGKREWAKRLAQNPELADERKKRNPGCEKREMQPAGLGLGTIQGQVAKQP